MQSHFRDNPIAIVCESLICSFTYIEADHADCPNCIACSLASEVEDQLPLEAHKAASMEDELAETLRDYLISQKEGYERIEQFSDEARWAFTQSLADGGTIEQALVASRQTQDGPDW